MPVHKSTIRTSMEVGMVASILSFLSISARATTLTPIQPLSKLRSCQPTPPIIMTISVDKGKLEGPSKELTLDLTGDLEQFKDKSKAFAFKEGSEYRIKVNFKVSEYSQLLTGLDTRIFACVSVLTLFIHLLISVFTQRQGQQRSCFWPQACQRHQAQRDQGPRWQDVGHARVVCDAPFNIVIRSLAQFLNFLCTLLTRARIFIHFHQFILFFSHSCIHVTHLLSR